MASIPPSRFRASRSMIARTIAMRERGICCSSSLYCPPQKRNVMKKNKRLLIAASQACAALLWQAPAAIADEAADVAVISLDRLQRLDALLERESAAGRLSGMVVAIARHGEVIQRNYGYMALASREPMRDDAMFRLYSMTKPIA